MASTGKKKQKQNNDRKNLFVLLQSTGPAWESGYLYRVKSMQSISTSRYALLV